MFVSIEKKTRRIILDAQIRVNMFLLRMNISHPDNVKASSKDLIYFYILTFKEMKNIFRMRIWIGCLGSNKYLFDDLYDSGFLRIFCCFLNWSGINFFRIFIHWVFVVAKLHMPEAYIFDQQFFSKHRYIQSSSWVLMYQLKAKFFL